VLKKELYTLCEDLGLSFDGGFCYGIVGKWPVRVLYEKYFQLQIAVDDVKNREAKASFRAAVKGWANFGVVGNDLLITLRAKKFDSKAECVRAALAALDSAGFRPMSVCPVCGRSGCNVAAPYRTEFRLAHRSCLDEAADEAGHKADVSKLKGSYLLGILGALIGMMIGTIPSLLTIIFAETEYAVLFALIPICAYFGYKLFGGRMNRAALIVTVIMAVLGVYVMTFELFVYIDIVEYGYAISDAFLLFIGYAAYVQNYVTLIGDLVVEFIFAAIGVFISWRIISRTPESQAIETEASIKLALPYGIQPAELNADPIESEPV